MNADLFVRLGMAAGEAESRVALLSRVCRGFEAWVGAGPRSVVVRDPNGAAIALGELRPGRTPEFARLRPNVVFPWAVRQGRAEVD